MIRRIYEEPKVEITRFTVENILTASGTGEQDKPEELTRNGVHVGSVDASSLLD